MAECNPCAPLKMRTYEQFDGSVWRNYESPSALFLLTGVGRKLIAGGNIAKLLRSYSDDYNQDQATPDGTRRFIAQGAEAKVFGVGDARLAIKEKNPQSNEDLFASLNRMDQLIDAVTYDERCPKWIGVPQHYGIVFFKKDPSKQFMLMEKIDEGVSVGDVLYHRAGHDSSRPDIYRPSSLRDNLEQTYGPITDEFMETIAGRFGMILGYLRRSLIAKYLSPDVYLPDIDQNPHNILLEPLAEPIDGSNIKFWIIDQ